MQELGCTREMLWSLKMILGAVSEVEYSRSKDFQGLNRLLKKSE
jgi:hypothetical protein